ncbi:MAG: hypothetical protein SNF33_03900 [Candidatus Algichlamydia australiensis]|nr:hypothetical protein [Chlamydiales bacterium]
MTSAVAKGAWALAQKLEPITAAMPTFAVIMSVGHFIHARNADVNCWKKNLAMAGALLLLSSSTLYNRSFGIIVSTIACIASQAITQSNCKHKN